MTTHRFEPSRFHNTLGAHEPVLRVQDGDAIETSTLDAAGHDAQGDARASSPNPQTGPFFVEGAQPGDTLTVTLESIRPNREVGWSSARLAPLAVPPQEVNGLPAPTPNSPRDAVWRVDNGAGTATLLEPSASAGLALPLALKLPLSPMLGCFGVSPRGGERISTATSAEHGGNMDYPGFVAGVTVHFPVAEPGALFFLGDGHALQGDGELAGTGIEISMDVRFSVRVLKAQAGGSVQIWPRGETSTHVFTVGNARPLDAALQHAVGEMLRWLSEMGLDQGTSNLLIGHAARFELGNMFDPAFTMICKLPRNLLPPR